MSSTLSTVRYGVPPPDPVLILDPTIVTRECGSLGHLWAEHPLLALGSVRHYSEIQGPSIYTARFRDVPTSGAAAPAPWLNCTVPSQLWDSPDPPNLLDLRPVLNGHPPDIQQDQGRQTSHYRH